MMKKNIIYLLLISIWVLSGCKKEDKEVDLKVFDRPVFDSNNPLDVKREAIYKAYNVLFKPVFTLQEYQWDWNNKVSQVSPEDLGQRYTPAKLAYAGIVIDSAEKWTIKVFPKSFSEKYMPLTVLLADTLKNDVLVSLDYDANGNLVYTYKTSQYEGYLASSYVMITHVSERFLLERDKRLLPERWLSLFIEKAIANGAMPFPDAFSKVSATGYALKSIPVADDYITKYAFLKNSREKLYILNVNHWAITNVRQDFGDYVAFIVYVPEMEKQTIYSKNASIKIKVQHVKDYFLKNFGFELPNIPKKP